MPYNDFNQEYIDRGWQEMQALLDREMPVSMVPVWKNWRVGLLLLLLPLLAWRDTHPLPVLETVARAAPSLEVPPAPADTPASESVPGSGPLVQKPMRSAAAGSLPEAEQPKDRPPVGSAGKPKAVRSDRRSEAASELAQPVPNTRSGIARLRYPERKESRSFSAFPPLAPSFTDLMSPSAGPRLPGVPAITAPGQWRFWLSGGMGAALAHPRPLLWGGVEAERLLHPKWSLWGGLAYQWNRLGAPEGGSDPAPSREQDAEVEFINGGWELDVLQSPSDLSSHRLGAIAGFAFRPHRAIRLEAGFQFNYFMPVEGVSGSRDENLFVPSLPSGPQANLRVIYRDLRFHDWEPVLHTGIYWRVSPAFQLGAAWQHGLRDLSRTEGYELRARQLRLGVRWRIGQ